MSFKAILYAYILGGFTFFPLVIALCIAWTIYTSVPVGDPDIEKPAKSKLWKENAEQHEEETKEQEAGISSSATGLGVALDLPKTRKAWLTIRRTFEEKETDGSYVNLMRSFLDSRSKDPKRSRPQDMWYAVLKSDVLFLYEDESMTECEAAIQLPAHQVTIFPEGLLDGELFTKRNCILLKPHPRADQAPYSVTKEMQFETVNPTAVQEAKEKNLKKELDRLAEAEKKADAARKEALDPSTPWFIFVRSCTEMEDWYLSLVHASSNPPNTSTLEPLKPVYRTEDMDHLVSTLDEQPDVIPMRWFNALLGRVFFSFYRTDTLESIIIGRLMKKLSKVKTPSFLQNIVVTEVSVGQNIPMFSKPMLKDLTKEGDAVVDVHISFRGELRITVEATAILSLSQHLKSYSVKLVLAVVLRELDGNLLIKLKRPPTNRLWYAFTQPPTMRLDVEPIVSDRQIKWTMILSTIESRLKEIINESVVMPNMDDIAFFDSSAYEHRGGIYADATRKAFKDKVSNKGAESEASSSQGHVKSHSTDELPTAPLSSPAPESLNVTRAETVAFPGDTGTLSKRKTWFSNGPKDAVDSSDVRLEPGTTSQSRDRGRSASSQAAEEPSSSSGKRATSVPAEIIVSEPESNVSEQASQRSSAFLSTHIPDTAPLIGDSLSDQQSRSIFSRNRTMSSSTSASVGDDRSSTGSSSGAASLLATIKAKAGDKQALSNSAKEAMRKWSANWNGFKREHLNKNSNNTSARESQFAGDALDEPDFLAWSEQDSRPRGASDADSRGTLNRRGSWKSKISAASGSSTETQSTPIAIPTSDSEKPQAEGYYGTGESSSSPNASASGGASTSGSLSKGSSSGSASSPGRSSVLKRYSGVLSASAQPAPAVTTDVHIGTTSPSLTATTNTKPVVSSSPYIEPSAASPHLPATFSPSLPSLPVSPNPTPIHKQPSQGASMMIPGIHASHRGEVMSMGYAPPPPTPPPHVATSPSLLSADNKSKSSTSTTIQGMYKLFMAQRSPSASAQTPESSSSVSPARLAEDSSSATANNSDGADPNPDVQNFSLPPPGNPYTTESIPQELPPKPDLPPRRKPTITTTPPPLPPRTLPNSSTSSNEQEADVGTTGAATSNAQLIMPSVNPTSSPASEALKVIVSQDEQQRRQSLDLDIDHSNPNIQQASSASAPASENHNDNNNNTILSNMANANSKRDSVNPRSALGARRVSRSLFPEFADEEAPNQYIGSSTSTSATGDTEHNTNGSPVRSGEIGLVPDESPRNGLVATHDLATTKPPLPPRKTPVSIAAQST